MKWWGYLYVSWNRQENNCKEWMKGNQSKTRRDWNIELEKKGRWILYIVDGESLLWNKARGALVLGCSFIAHFTLPTTHSPSSLSLSLSLSQSPLNDRTLEFLLSLSPSLCWKFGKFGSGSDFKEILSRASSSALNLYTLKVMVCFILLFLTQILTFYLIY